MLSSFELMVVDGTGLRPMSKDGLYSGEFDFQTRVGQADIRLAVSCARRRSE
jgi:hypothetical protein